MRRLRTLVALAGMVTAQLLSPPVHAQKITGTITGTVTDNSGAAVPNATVTVTNTATGKVYTVITDGQGSYTVPELAESSYTVDIKAANFKESVTNNAVVHVA